MGVNTWEGNRDLNLVICVRKRASIPVLIADIGLNGG